MWMNRAVFIAFRLCRHVCIVSQFSLNSFSESGAKTMQTVSVNKPAFGRIHSEWNPPQLFIKKGSIPLGYPCSQSLVSFRVSTVWGASAAWGRWGAGSLWAAGTPAPAGFSPDSTASAADASGGSDSAAGSLGGGEPSDALPEAGERHYN